MDDAKIQNYSHRYCFFVIFVEIMLKDSEVRPLGVPGGRLHSSQNVHI